MRIWHESLIPHLCRQHLLAMWREANGAYKIITEGKKGYRNHPATKEFEESVMVLYDILSVIREEMLKRGYHPKAMPEFQCFAYEVDNRGLIDELGVSEIYDQQIIKRKENQWQTLDQQIAILKQKGCECRV